MPVKTLAPKGVDLGVVPHQLEEGKSASEDARSRKGVDCDVPHWLGREEGKSTNEDARSRRGVDCDVPHWLGREERKSTSKDDGVPKRGGL